MFQKIRENGWLCYTKYWILKSQISSYLKLIYGLSGNDFRVATLSKSNLTYTGIKMPKLTISVISCGRTDGPKLKKNICFENAGFFMILRISLEVCFLFRKKYWIWNQKIWESWIWMILWNPANEWEKVWIPLPWPRSRSCNVMALFNTLYLPCLYLVYIKIYVHTINPRQIH